jgi:hypothetical protein
LFGEAKPSQTLNKSAILAQFKFEKPWATLVGYLIKKQVSNIDK